MQPLILFYPIPCAYFQGEEKASTLIFFIFSKRKKITKVKLIYKYYLICCVTE